MAIPIGVTRPIALTIAGSDSGGGAGIQADLKTFHAFRVFGASAVTAITAQNTMGVTAVHPVPVDVVRAQIDAVVEDLRPRAVKSGMLATAALVEAVAERIAAHRLDHYVLDPVLVATSGARLLDPGAESALLTRLLPLAAVVTPNLLEAEVLTGAPVRSVTEMRDAARALVELGAGAALIKGGHLEGTEAVDVLWDGRAERVWRRPRIASGSTHGTGCTLAAAIAAGLARGASLDAAADRGLAFVARAIASAPGLGRGAGPIDHFAAEGADPLD